MVLLASAWPAAVHSLDGDIPIAVAAGSQLPDAVVSDGRGGGIVVWNDSRSGNADIYAQHVQAAGDVDPAWTVNGLAICSAQGEQWAAAAVTDGTGGAIVVWHDFRGGNVAGAGDIYAQHVLANGSVDPRWPPDGRAICLAPGDQLYPTITTDGSGGAIIAWRDARNGTTDVCAQHVLASGVIDPAWPAGGRFLCTALGNQDVDAIVTDEQGGALVVWVDGRSQVDADIYAQHVLSQGTVDPAWPDDGLAIRSGPSEQDNASAVSDGAGGAIVVWTDAHRNPAGDFFGTFDVFAQHVLTSGSIDSSWPLSGLGVCTAQGDQLLGGITPDGLGGAIVAWQDFRNGSPSIYAQHLQTSGTSDPAWPVDGLPLCAGVGGERDAPRIASDGRGGATIVWADRRFTDYDIFTAQVRRRGFSEDVLFGKGRPLCVASGSQIDPEIAADAAGRAVVVWRDYRNGDADIHGRCINAGPSSKVSVASSSYGLSVGQRGGGTKPEVDFTLPNAQAISLDVFDPAGRHVCSLMSSQQLEAGVHVVGIDTELDQGVYLVRLIGAGGSMTRKLSIVR